MFEVVRYDYVIDYVSIITWTVIEGAIGIERQ